MERNSLYYTLIFLFLLLPVFAHAQLGLDIVSTNNGFETFVGTADDGTSDSWTGFTTANLGATSIVEAVTDAHSGSYAVYGHPEDPAGRIQKLDFACANATLYELRIWYKTSDGIINPKTSIRDGSGTPNFFEPTLDLTVNYVMYADTFTSVSTTLDWYFGLVNNEGFKWYIDDLYIRARLGTQYISSAGNDAAVGESGTPILTHSEAFEIRGWYNGGIFSTAVGIYDESITIPTGTGSFTWSATGAATVTSVDFNSVTCTVDLANLTIGTILNDENVTYLNADDGQDKGYNESPKHPGFKDWE